jgi:flagellar P-ring protein precursor FlgI
VTRNQTNAGRVPEGGRVVKDIPFTVPSEGEIRLHLDDPDFTVANRLAAALNTYWGGAQAATAIDAGRVAVTMEKLPEPRSYAAALAVLDEVRVEPSQQAKIVINERTGTLVAGGDVRLQPATVSHGNLQVRIESGYMVAQPMPYSVGGQTVVVPESSVDAVTDKGDVVSLPATATADELATALNALGVEPRDLIAIFQALKEAGALNAKMEIL